MTAPARIKASRFKERNGRVTITFDVLPAVEQWICRQADAEDMRPGTWVRAHFMRLASADLNDRKPAA